MMKDQLPPLKSVQATDKEPICVCGHPEGYHWPMGTSENMIILPRCRHCKCERFKEADADALQSATEEAAFKAEGLTPVAWSKERGFYWSPDGAYYRRADVNAMFAAHCIQCPQCHAAALKAGSVK